MPWGVYPAPLGVHRPWWVICRKRFAPWLADRGKSTVANVRAHFVISCLSWFLLAGCATPPEDAVVAEYRPPPGNRSPYLGMLNFTQMRHMERATFPRLTAPERDEMRAVNRAVNHDIAYLSDAEDYGLAERQVTEPAAHKPLAFGYPTGRYGDCEDYALTKKARLVARGWEPSRLFVVVAGVPEHGETFRHAVVAVPEGSDWWILNNQHNTIELASALESWWGWRFIWPSFRDYRARLSAPPDGARPLATAGR